MTNDELFLLTLSVQDRNCVNYFMRVYNVSVQEAYKILKGEIKPPCVHETPAAVHEIKEPVHETAKAVPPPADPENHTPVNWKEY